MASERTTLQQRRSGIERRRKSCRFVSQAATYPVHTVAGTNAGRAAKLSAACAVVMETRLKIRVSFAPTI
jgi:hypothetical protein